MNNERTLGATIRLARVSRQIGLRELARLVGRSSTMLSRIESGAVIPGRDLIGRLASVLGLDPDGLFCAAGHVPPDLQVRLSSDPALCRTVRELLKTA